MKKIIGVDVGGTHVRCGLVDESGALTAFEVKATANFMQQGGFLVNFADYLANFAQNHQNIGVSVGFPSTIDKQRRVLLSTPNIAGMDNVPAADILESCIKGLVLIDKDVNHLLICDMARFNLSSNLDILGFYIGTGLGNAVYLNGKLLYGANGAAGELGHIPFKGAKERCNCGNIGCSEIYASGKALQNIKDRYFPDTSLQDIFVRHTHHESIIEFMDNLAVTIAAEVNILDPDCIIIGGGVAQMKSFPFKILKERILGYARKPYPANSLIVYHSTGDQTDGVVGAAINGFRIGGSQHGK